MATGYALGREPSSALRLDQVRRPRFMSPKEKARCPADYFPDLDQWPNDWMEIKGDVKIGRGLLTVFIPFIQHLIDEGLAKKTIKNHGTHLGMLGGEIIWSLNRVDGGNRKLSPRKLILHYVDDQGGPLLSFWEPDEKTRWSHQMAYDATCRKLFKFITRKNS